MSMSAVEHLLALPTQTAMDRRNCFYFYP